MFKRLRKVFLRLFLFFTLSMIAGLGFIWLTNKWIEARASNQLYSDVSKIPAKDVGLLLGASKHNYLGNINLFFKYRMEAAAKLYKAGKIKHIIVSGDNHTKGYDEPSDMRDYLISLGVPARNITCDYAGFRTLDSVVRCKEVFGQKSVTIISQTFHNERALFLADKHDLDAVAFNAKNVPANYYKRIKYREYLARAKAVIDVYVLHKSPKYLGEPVLIKV